MKKIKKIIFWAFTIFWTGTILFQQYTWWNNENWSLKCLFWAIIALSAPIIVYLTFKD